MDVSCGQFSSLCPAERKTLIFVRAAMTMDFLLCFALYGCMSNVTPVRTSTDMPANGHQGDASPSEDRDIHKLRATETLYVQRPIAAATQVPPICPVLSS